MIPDGKWYQITAAIDAKASALLTHISIMTAIAAGFFISSREIDVLYRQVLIGELISYIVVSLLCFLAMAGVRGGLSTRLREAALGLRDRKSVV